MSSPRFYHPSRISLEDTIILNAETTHHLRIIRIGRGDTIIIFNGDGCDYSATVLFVERNQAVVKINSQIKQNRESSLEIHLAQGISRGEKMDFVIQKAVELGVTSITPLLTEHGNVKLTEERWEKKQLHWQNIIISACEQCGRNQLPQLNAIEKANDWIAKPKVGLKLALHPEGQKKLSSLPEKVQSVSLLIGPEGGLSHSEVSFAEENEFQLLRLGPRILRTETAPIVIIAALQSRWGDF